LFKHPPPPPTRGTKFLVTPLDMIDKLIKTGRNYGMEMNVEKTKVITIS
jgi:hypothetical protein